MRLVVDAARIKTPEIGARLDQRRDAASQAIALRMALSQLGREQVGEFDLADFALDLEVGHAGLEVMLEAVFAEELDEKFLGEIGVRCPGAFLDQQAGAARGANQ